MTTTTSPVSVRDFWFQPPEERAKIKADVVRWPFRITGKIAWKITHECDCSSCHEKGRVQAKGTLDIDLVRDFPSRGVAELHAMKPDSDLRDAMGIDDAAEINNYDHDDWLEWEWVGAPSVEEVTP